jgi:tetratricopeptide (TPR) repeat protein
MTRSISRVVSVVILAVLVRGGASTRAVQDRQEVSLQQLLELYDLGEFDTARDAVRSASRSGDLRVVLEALEREGEKWITADGEAHHNRRNLTAALFALEVAEAGLDQQWSNSHQLLEWACTRMRTQRQRTEVERTFHLAAIALIEGARDVKALDEHVAHVAKRFPDEPRILLARAFKAEVEYWRLYRTMAGGVDGGSPVIIAPPLRKAAERRENAREVALRLGFLAQQKDQHDDALAELEKVAPGDDPGQLYLAHLISGWAYEKLQKRSQAEAAYRRALAVIPQAQSATLHLAVLLYEIDRRSEANELVARMLSADPAPDDPWRVYGYGDYRRFPLLMDRLRRSIQ